ncbi:hypothetical protein ACS0TY_032714 [Phlomoides rotata]
MNICGSRKPNVILVILLNLLTFMRAQQDDPFSCTSNGNYTSNSTYSTNLNTLLDSLSLNITDNGYYSSSVGQNPDTANALALCRADQTLQQCRSCVQSAARDLLRLCRSRKQGAVWSEYCMVRYSNDPILRTLTSDPGPILLNTFNVSNGDRFRDDRAKLLEDLRVLAANGSSALKAGAGSRNTSDSESNAIYALVQCTPELSPEECRSCLIEVVQPIRSCCDVSRGVRMLNRNCNIRYELYSFYNETRLKELRVLLPPARPPSPTGKKDDSNNTTKVVIIIVVLVVVCLILTACAVIYMRRRMKQRSYEITNALDDDISSVAGLQYDFSTIRAATNDFNDADKLGQGGFGAVYKGKLQTGEEIAVKRLSKDSGQGNEEFKNEVLLLAKLQHRNLVRLLGFSMEGTERVLLYEFVKNASLDKFIFDPIKRSTLDWDKRFKIIGGIAKGLVYLHEDSRLKIIHRDMKASNVLLDGDMHPKIADFGMARLFDQDETQGNTSKVVGTYGYMSPEYAMRGMFSDKSDVFSFGVLVLEIVSGQRNNYIQNGESVDDLLTLTWKNWREGTPENMIDPVLLKNGTGSVREMLRCMHMGLLCVQENAANRPTMVNVVLMLSSSTMTMSVPLEPAFYAASRFGPDTKESNANAGISEASSRNDISVTELYPR